MCSPERRVGVARPPPPRRDEMWEGGVVGFSSKVTFWKNIQRGWDLQGVRVAIFRAMEPCVLCAHRESTFVGDEAAKLAEELAAALKADVQIVLAHEVDPARGGCEFAHFFAGIKQGCDSHSTPST